MPPRLQAGVGTQLGLPNSRQRDGKDILWRTYKEVVSDHVMLIAAGVTFYALLALVPTLTSFRLAL